MTEASADGARASAANAVSFLAATDFELRSVRLGMRMAGSANAPEGFAVAAKCGIGCSIGLAFESLHRCAISCGFAAGLRDGLRCGSVLLPKTVYDDAGRFFEVDAGFHERIGAAVAKAGADDAVSTDPIVQLGDVVCTPADKRSLSRGGHVVGADMESASIASACMERGVPFVVLRIVLDAVDLTLPLSLRAAVANGGEPGLRALLAEIARRPADWRHLLPFARATMIARRALVDSVAAVAAEFARRPG